MLRNTLRRLANLNVWERLALVLWTAALAFLTVRSVLWPHSHSVYPIFADAARSWLAGADLYKQTGEAYRYSPLVAVSFVPLALLPDALGAIIWRVLNVVVYLVALAWWCRAVLPRSLTRTQWAWLLLLLLPLSLGNLNNGQSNILIVGLLLAAVAGVANGVRPSAEEFAPTGRLKATARHCLDLAALCAALACLFKLYPLAVGLLLVVVASRQFGWRLLLMLVLGLVLPFFMQRPGYVADQYSGWLHHLESNDRQLLPQALWYRDLRLLCTLGGLPLSYHGYLVVQVLTGGALALVCLAASRADWPLRRVLTLVTVLGCCWMTVFGSATESATYVLLAPVAAWFLLDAWLRRRPSLYRGVLTAAYAGLLAVQVAGWFRLASSTPAQVAQPLAALLLLGAALAEALPARRLPNRRRTRILVARAVVMMRDPSPEQPRGNPRFS